MVSPTKKTEKIHKSFKPHLGLRISDWEKIGVIKEILTLAVSSRGSGLCIYLPKDLCEVYGIISGDRVKVQLLDQFRKAVTEDY